jgi:hypothetical protein
MEEDKPKKKSSKVQVRVIGSNLQASTLVELSVPGKLQRFVVPSSSVKDGLIDEEELEMGVPYGIPWETALPPLRVKVEDLAHELRLRDIWTAEDALRNPQAVYGALQAVYGVELSTILQTASNHPKKGR